VRHRSLLPGLLLPLAVACGGPKSPLVSTGTTISGATSGSTGGTSTTGGTGTATTTGAATTGGAGSGTTTGGAAGGCGADHCTLANGACGWSAAGSGPCNLPGANGNLVCCPGLTCSSAHVCGLPPGTVCSDDSQCQSGSCGVHGTGYCCASACASIVSACAATGCDEAGACLYPGATTPCGPGGSCSGYTQTDAASCDGRGNCLAPTRDCAPFSCGDGGVCLTNCTTNRDCTSGRLCDVPTSTCCPSVGNNGTLAVDGVLGSDATACCSLGHYGPCQTVSRAMALIDAAQAKDVTIVATVDGGGGDWTPTGEVYPIVLGWGVELSAPGVFFFDSPAGVMGTTILDVNFYSAFDTVGYASIVGTASSPVIAGENAGTTVAAAIGVETGNTLYIANATIDNKWGVVIGVYVHGGATLVLGQDQAAATTGTVYIGDWNYGGVEGISCGVETVGAALVGCTIRDAPMPVGQSSVVIQKEGTDEIGTGGAGEITLTSNPVFGVAPSAPGFGNCAAKLDAEYGAPAIRIAGSMNVTLKNATLQCIGGTALAVEAIPGFPFPTVTLDNVLIQNTNLGIYASAGTVNVTNSTVRYNVIGVQQAYDAFNHLNGTINLADGGNTVICSNYSENAGFSRGPSPADGGPGIDVWNTSKASLNASNVAWDTAGPDYFKCDLAFTSCTCNLTACSSDAGVEDMDAVEDSKNLGGIVTTGSTQSPNGCK
jgi:hypothetical protein